MTSRTPHRSAPVLLTVEQAAERLNTGPRFVRRLIAERRIEFHHVGRHIRISEATLADFIAAGRVEPITVRWRGGRVVALWPGNGAGSATSGSCRRVVIKPPSSARQAGVRRRR